MPSFPRGNDFPNEGFVQKAIEAYFTEQGFTLLDEGYTDLACVRPQTGERWVVEAKGHSKALNVDFNTCLGQLLKRMHDDESGRFGLALPDIPQYHRQIGLISRRVRHALNLHWILVAEDGRVVLYAPGDELAHHASS